MRSKITVVGERTEQTIDRLREGDRFAVAAVAPDSWADLAGSDDIVVTDGADVQAAAVAVFVELQWLGLRRAR